ncbi:hypothetical protein F1880_008896 [Penicillium rolfsii]|nr:hypothetical protein F1880_008896 [Penicillium rolfsii]
MVVGGCYCGKVRVQLNGHPLRVGLCHCLDCRKLTGSIYSFGYVVKTADLEVSGSPKAMVKSSDSGNERHNFFCPDCGTPVFGQGMKADGTPEPLTVLRAGIIEDPQFLTRWKPQAELFTDRRLEWVTPIDGATQCSGMLSLS